MAEEKEALIRKYFTRVKEDGKIIKKGYSYGDNFYGITHLIIHLEDNCIPDFSKITKRNMYGAAVGDWSVFHYKGTTVVVEDKKDQNKAFLAVMSDNPNRTRKVFNHLEKMALFKNVEKIAIEVKTNE